MRKRRKTRNMRKVIKYAGIFAALFGAMIGLSLSACLRDVSAETSLGAPEAKLPQPVASYKIDVQLKLDDKRHPMHLEASERLTWLNDSPDTISDLQFHLYLNAFKNEKSD